MTTWRNQLGVNERQKIVTNAHNCLWTVEGKDALAYLREKRGLSEEAIRQFQIGYVPLRVDHQLSGRVITPIYDSIGNLVAVSTRHLFKPKSEAFWHEDFEKKFYLYGLHIARKEILRTGKAIVVEGEFDTVFLHSNGIKIAVGLCGSALGLYHVSLLARYCKRIFLLFDGDKGGDKAFKFCKKLYYDNLVGIVDLIPCRMPIGSDPDDFVKEHKTKGLIELMQTSEKTFKDNGYSLKEIESI